MNEQEGLQGSREMGEEERRAWSRRARELTYNDWTRDPARGGSNNSHAYIYLAGVVEHLIRRSGESLINGRADVVGRLIMSQLAHKYDVRPAPPVRAALTAYTARVSAITRDAGLSIRQAEELDDLLEAVWQALGRPEYAPQS